MGIFNLFLLSLIKFIYRIQIFKCVKIMHNNKSTSVEKNKLLIIYIVNYIVPIKKAQIANCKTGISN